MNTDHSEYVHKLRSWSEPRTFQDYTRQKQISEAARKAANEAFAKAFGTKQGQQQ